MSSAVNTAIGSVAIASFLFAFSIMKSRKSTLADIAEEIFHTPYFHTTKKLGSKDEVIVGMLESCQEKGPCYVITDPDLAGNQI